MRSIRPTASAALGSSRPTVWFEVEDFLDYFEWKSGPTGIQRVQMELFAAAGSYRWPEGDIRFCRLNRLTRHFEPVSLRGLEAAFDRPAFVQRLPRAWLRARLRALRINLRMLHGRAVAMRDWIARRANKDRPDFEPGLLLFEPGDILMCLGNAWEDTRYSEFIGLARRKRGLKFAVLVYDLFPITHPQWVHAENAAIFGQWFSGMLEHADMMFAISDYSRASIQAFAARLGRFAPPVDVLPLGTGFRVTTPTIRPGVLAKLPPRYVVFVSTLSARKNHGFAVRIWQRLIAAHGAGEIPHLVMVGQIGWAIDGLIAELEANRYLDGKILVLSDLSDAEVREVYRGCLFSIYPSLAEGWGLPIAESLEHGKLCIASDRTAMPEVGGSLADLIDPEDLSEAVAAVERAIFDTGYRVSREAQIRAEYRPTSWAFSFAALMTGLEALLHRDDRGTASSAAGADALLIKRVPEHHGGA
ncbi:MAG TPA: glycosyltransferase family 1 protein [Stellaceae bacterium]|nr:glycosyltransferase family 1 protein [Stellaceae bacterium]